MKLANLTILGAFGAQLVHGVKFDEVKEGLEELQNYIGLLKLGEKLNILKREPFPLSTPRQKYPVTDAEFKEFLPHSSLPVCNPTHMSTKQCFCPGKFEAASLIVNKTMESQAMIAVDPKNKLIVASYRGTVTKKNWETNEDVDLVSYPGVAKGKVHHGDLLYLQSLQPACEAAALRLFKTPKYRGYQLHVTGYSLGGAVAAVSTPMWMSFLKRNNLKNKMRVFLYSNPRPGDPAYARYLESTPIPIVRYTRKGDVVPHLPEQSMGFAQVGAEYFEVNATQSLKHCASNLLEDPKCSMGDKNFAAINHLLPFGKLFPIPTIC
ncbi:hypothetical protein DSO57_1024964 [Entomophthora muscae]|uniref:Uncharacterized protein n=1 Tax=Entomophthora muscae TaxID=34485 RepID=A0ACC2RTP9_9FUNG|nr:hypothetical protein DSO57_1024964 [Entomophthora muscae]